MGKAVNKVYKVIWSCCSNAFVVVSELAGSRTSGGGARSERRAASGQSASTVVSRIATWPGTGARRVTLLAAAVTLTLAGAQPVWAQSVIGTGDLNPSFPGGSLPSWDVGSSTALFIGQTGSGSLTIKNGGIVSNGTGHIGNDEGADGQVTVTDDGSQWKNNGSIYVGYSGIGTLNIENGGSVSVFNHVGIADEDDSNGELTITGDGSKLTGNAEVWVGNRGLGRLTIADGGSLSSYAGHIGNWDDSEGEVTVTGVGSAWENSGALSIGGRNTGTLTIADGGRVSNTSGTIAKATGGEGTVTVTGAGSEWENTVDLYVGQWGAGTLTIADGGKVVSSGSLSEIGTNAASQGEVTVTGAGSQWQNAEDLIVGARGTGTLIIENGGKVTTGKYGVISEQIGSQGEVTVTGAGSEWQNTNNLYVGKKTKGTLTIANGGKVSSRSGFISDGGSSQGTVTVTGAGSVWENSNELLIGGGSTGTLTIADGGKVSSTSSYIGATGGTREGTLNIGAAEGDAATAAGILDTPELNFRSGVATLVFNHTDTNYVFAAALKKGAYSGGTRTVKHLAGTTTLTGDGSGFNGTTTVSGGTLIVDGTLGGNVEAQTTGAVSGNGTLRGNADFTGSGVLAGEQGTQLRINGNVIMDTTSEVNVALGGPSGSGLFDVGGDLTLDGTLNVADAGGFGAGVYRIFDYAGALADNGLDIGATPAGVNQTDLTVQTSVANQVNLISSAAASGELRFWDGGDATLHNNNAIDGGDGSLLANGDNWTNLSGSSNGSYQPNPSFAVFQGAAGLVTVDESAGAIGVTGIQFAADGYLVEGDAIALAGVGGESIIRVGDGTASSMTATIASELTGTSTLVKSDFGTLVLQGNNSYTGGTRIESGVLSVSSDANLGDPSGALVLAGGMLATTGSFVSNRDIVMPLAARFDVASGTELELAGNITSPGAGSGNLGKYGDGTLKLSGSNDYGGTRVVEGTLIGNVSSIAGNIRNAGTVVFDQSSDATFTGRISGDLGTDGVMVKDGTGTLTLDGAHYAYTSDLDWTVSEGGLQAKADRFFGNAHLDGAATTLTFVDAGSAVYAGVLSGNGQFDFNGTGQLLLTGDSSGFAGTTIFENGTLIVGGSGGNGALGGSLDVSNGALLGGSGTVGSGAGSLITLASGGTLAPGNSIGTLTIAGDLVFESGSRFEVEVDPQGADSDRIEVTGDATLSGGSVVHVGDAGDYKLNSSYTILTAGGTLAGAFDDVSSNFAFLTPGLTYDYGAGTVDLELERNKRDFASAAITDNQKATAKGIESIGVGAGHAVYSAIAKLPDDPASIQASFDALSGEIHASAKTALIEDSRFIRNAATDRMRGAFAAPGASHAPVRAHGSDGAPTSVAPSYAGPAFWSHAFGSWGKTDDDGNAASLNRDIGGFLIGADRQVGDWRMGVMAGYGHSSFKAHDRDSSAKSDSYHLGLYGATTWDELGLRAGAAYSRHDIDTQRSVTMPGLSDRLSADYKADSFQVFGELGYAIELGDTRLEPFANLAYVAMHTDGYSEDGGAAALSGRSENMDVTFTTLGLHAEHSLSLGATQATLRGTLGWRHAFGDTTPESTHAFSAGDAFTMAGVPIAKDSAVLEAGVDLNLTPNATFGLSYIGQIAGSARDHGVKANLTIKF